MQQENSNKFNIFPIWIPLLLLGGFLVLQIPMGFVGYVVYNMFMPEHRNVAFDVSPDGNEIVFSAADENLYLLRLRSNDVKQLTGNIREETSPSFSPDGGTVVFSGKPADQDASHLYLIELASGKVRQVTSGQTHSDFRPRFTEKGASIVFERARERRPYSMGGHAWENRDVYRVNTDGSGKKRLTKLNVQDLIGISGKRRSNHLYIENVDTLFKVDRSSDSFPLDSSDLRKTEPLVERVTDFDISTNNRFLSYFARRRKEFQDDLYVQNLKTGKTTLIPVTDRTQLNQNPVVSPAGDSIFYLGHKKASLIRLSLYRVSVESRTITRIAGPSLFDDPLDWSPNK